jgi:hypothetical protein
MFSSENLSFCEIILVSSRPRVGSNKPTGGHRQSRSMRAKHNENQEMSNTCVNTRGDPRYFGDYHASMGPRTVDPILGCTVGFCRRLPSQTPVETGGGWTKCAAIPTEYVAAIVVNLRKHGAYPPISLSDSCNTISVEFTTQLFSHESTMTLCLAIDPSPVLPRRE